MWPLCRLWGSPRGRFPACGSPVPWLGPNPDVPLRARAEATGNASAWPPLAAVSSGAWIDTCIEKWTNILAKEVGVAADAAEQFNIHEAKTNLSRIVERVERGEEIVISRAGHPVAKVVPLVRRVNRTAGGSLRGVDLGADWDSDETNAAIADDFGMPR